MTEVGEKLRAVLVAKSWSQSRAALELGISQSQISRLLAGKTLRTSRAAHVKIAKSHAEMVMVARADTLADSVAAEAKENEKFRRLLEAAIALVHNNA